MYKKAMTGIRLETKGLGFTKRKIASLHIQNRQTVQKNQQFVDNNNLPPKE